MFINFFTLLYYMLGKPVIKGTRLTLEFIRELLAQGWTHQQMLKNYPQLKTELKSWEKLSDKDLKNFEGLLP